MILAQAMMAFPFVLAVLWVFVFLGALLLLLPFRLLLNKLFRNSDAQSRYPVLIFAALAASLVCGYFIYRIWTFDGPWIN
ncbi:MAG: hypothetical protein JNL02_04985 [Saprospiraceae bacterium]|nr:hypothetical protein [Saprospiraceae bacterium]